MISSAGSDQFILSNFILAAHCLLGLVTDDIRLALHFFFGPQIKFGLWKVNMFLDPQSGHLS